MKRSSFRASAEFWRPNARCFWVFQEGEAWNHNWAVQVCWWKKEWTCPREGFHCSVPVWSYQMLTESQSNLDWEGCTEVLSKPLLRAALINSGCLTFRLFNRASVSSVKQHWQEHSLLRLKVMTDRCLWSEIHGLAWVTGRQLCKTSLICKNVFDL